MAGPDNPSDSRSPVSPDAFSKSHPSRSLPARARGFGVAAGYEKPRRRGKGSPHRGQEQGGEGYGPMPHAGYYGSGIGTGPFQRGQAGFDSELEWYRSQYGEETAKPSGKR
jgi:hypothetical protein